MISAPAGIRIVVATAPVDGRKGMDSLAAVVQQALRESPFSGDIFIFRTKRADRIKIVAWDGTGLWLHQKRLEGKGKGFAWPPVRDGSMILSAAQLAMLLEGLEWWRIVPKKVNAPSIAC
jgi:transposase